jgi:regulator of protease activity HflC (stomatin/prohibitin superfamily)
MHRGEIVLEKWIAPATIIIVIVVIRKTSLVQQARAFSTRASRLQHDLERSLHLKYRFLKSREDSFLKEQVVDFQPHLLKPKTMSLCNRHRFTLNNGPKALYFASSIAHRNRESVGQHLRTIIGDLELDQTLTSRDPFNTKLRTILTRTEPWGIKVKRVELKISFLRGEIQDAMEKQKKASVSAVKLTPR